MANRVYVMGDIHGDCRPIRDFYLRNKIKFNKSNNKSFDGTDTMILLGDAGLNFFFNARDEREKEKLGKYPFIYFIVRGNHEERPSICMEKNPENWHTEKYFGNTVYVENEYPYIKYALDEPAYYVIAGYNTFIFPGAYSVDKFYRLQMNWSWFPKEQLSEEEMQEGERMCEFWEQKCHLVLSHTCPVFYEPTDLFLPQVDQSMVDKTMERYLGQIECKLDYKAWLWGHYHAFRDYPRIDGRRRTMLFNDCVIDLTEYMKEEEIKKY